MVIDGVVPSWPMNGRSRVARPTMSWGANARIGFWTEFSGSAAYRAGSRAIRSAASWGSVDADLARVIERDRVAVRELERSGVGAALDAAH